MVYRNAAKLVEAKHRLGRSAPVLRWQFLAFEHNVHEIEAALEMAKQLALDQFVVEIPFDVSWDQPDIHPANIQPFHVDLTPGAGEILEQNWSPRSAPAAEIIAREFARDFAAASPAESPSPAPHTCRWLYKSLTLDANGRILPCCGAPKPGADVVFGSLGPTDLFNSAHYQQARRSFANPPVYESAKASGAPAPYCANCEWDQDRTEFGPGETAQYLRTASRGALDSAAVAICSDW